MNNLLNYIPLLKVGCSKENYPLYSQSIYFDGETIRICNDDVYVCLNYQSDIRGCLNLFVLESVLKIAAKHREVEFVVANEHLTVHSPDGYTASLGIDSITDFPLQDMPETPLTEVTDDMLLALNDAILFNRPGGKAHNLYIYMDKEHIMATSNMRCFLSNVFTAVSEYVGINKKMLSVLDDTCMIGSYDNNTLIKFDSGFVKFTIDLLDGYPADKLLQFVNDSREGVLKLCNMGVLNEALSNLAPISQGEKVNMCTFSNTGNELTLKAQSMHGVIETKVDSELEVEYKTEINIDQIKNLPANYDVYVNPDDVKILYLKSTYGEIVVKENN